LKRLTLSSLAGLVLISLPAFGGPLFDPFLEKFQVGTYGDPDALPLELGFPSDLMEPAELDDTWLRGVSVVLGARGEEANSYLTHVLLERQLGEIAFEAWLGGMGVLLEDLEAGSESTDWGNDRHPLKKERAAAAVFGHAAAGRTLQAAALAIRLRDGGSAWGLSDREVFIWDLRAKFLFRKAGNRTAGRLSTWPTMLDLGPYDTGNAWTLWMAHCRWEEQHPLPEAMTTEEWGRHLARISRLGVTPEELYGSGLSADFQAGIGAVNFKGATRDAHFTRFPAPPADKSLQGLWVRGRRLQSGGDPGVYEQLARRDDLLPGWRLDLWRRASELHLLKGAWDQGLADLEQALVLAGDGAGHWTTRRRLRQWNEQALVLALARDDGETARQLRELGLEYFQGKEREAFLEETSHWNAQLGLEDPGSGSADLSLKDEAGVAVSAGSVRDLTLATDDRRDAFVTAASGHLWDLWIKWGLTLANPAPVEGLVKERAIDYGQALSRMAEIPDPRAQQTAALQLVADRLGGSPVFDRMVAQALDHDVVRASGGSVAPEPSLVPAILPLLKGSELDRHALLGFALAAGDMRGILAVAVALEGRGLTTGEKRRFLYPLPAPGAIREAIVDAASDPALLLAVARNESLFEPSVRSRAGALGWMQIMPFHYDQRGAVKGANNWRHPGVSISRGDGLLVENGKRYGDDPYRGVAAYNAGPGAASRWDKQLGGGADRDIYLAWIGYPETRHYVEKVLIDREIYDWIIRTESSR
jgi:soluble lytic murein transglycosylase